jgi:hypothetical protein
MTDMNAIANKIQHLLNKTVENGATEAEAQAALLMAQKLMAKYNIELEQQTGSKDFKCSLEETKVKPNPRNNSLGNIIANSFAVKGIIYDGKWAFFGREANAKAAAECLKFIHKTLEAGIRRVCADHGLKSSERGAAFYYNAYALGFIRGLQEAMAAQTKALCVVVPEDVNNKFNEKFPKLNQYRGKGMQYHHDQDAYAQGQRDGRSAMDRRSLQQG